MLMQMCMFIRSILACVCVWMSLFVLTLSLCVCTVYMSLCECCMFQHLGFHVFVSLDLNFTQTGPLFLYYSCPSSIPISYKHVVLFRSLGIFSSRSRDWDVRLVPWPGDLHLGTCARDGLQDTFGISFSIFLSDGGQMALIMLLEAHFVHFCDLAARLLSQCLWTQFMASGSYWLYYMALDL